MAEKTKKEYMKAAFFLLFAVALLTPQLRASGSPLVFYASKDIDSTAFVEIASLDTAKFKQVRIHIENVHEKVASRSDYSSFRVQLVAAEKDAEVVLVSSVSEIRYSTVLDTPPSKLKVNIAGRGTFKIFIWASV